MLKRLVPSLLGLVALAQPLAAATDGERDNHFQTMRDLIGREMHLVAKRQLEAYRSAGYDDPSGAYNDSLQWLFYDTFALDVPGEVGAQYSADAKRLSDKLAGMRDKLPPLPADTYAPSGKVQRIATKLSRDLIKPDSPPPFKGVGYSADEVAAIESLVKLLIDTADATLKEQLKAVTDYEPIYEKSFGMDEGPEYWKIVQNATMLRFDHANTFYQAYKPLREITIRRQGLIDAGVPAALIDEVVAKWLKETSVALGQTYNDWDWSFGDYYIYLRHRLAVLQGEYVRHTRGDKKAAFGYDDAQTVFFSGIEVDTGSFGKEMRDTVQKFKYDIWSDLLYWHLTLGDEASLKKAVQLWGTFKELSDDDRKFSLDSKDQYRNVMAGHLSMLMGRIFMAQGDVTSANGQMAEVQSVGNFFQGNAKGWIAYWAGGGNSQGSDPWFVQPRSMAPEKALTLARALISQANKVLEKEQANNFYEQAASALRDGVLGLPADPTDKAFIDFAPAVYQTLGYALYKRGWYFQAVTVVQQGLGRFSPELWGAKPKRENPWFDARGKMSPAGAMVQRLASDGMAYSQALYARTRAEAANTMLTEAIDQLRAFDPSKVEDNSVRMEIVLLIQAEEYQRAHDKAFAYYEENRELAAKKKGEEKLETMVEALWGLRMATRSMFQLWESLLKATVPNEADIEKASARLEELATGLEKMAGLAPKIPAKYRGEFVKAQQEVLNFIIAKMFAEERYEEIVATLDGEFWANAPRDEELVRGFLGYLAGAVFRLNKDEAARINEAAKGLSKAVDQRAAMVELINDAIGSMLAQWPNYTGAHDNFERVLRSYPALDTSATSVRKQLAQVFNVSNILLERLVVPNIGAVGEAKNGMLRAWLTAAAGDETDLAVVLKGISKEAFKAADANADGSLSDAELDSGMAASAVAEAMMRDAKSRFADLYEPIIDADEKENTLLAVANTLWDLDEKSRAAKLYEMYKERLQKDAALQAFLADPLVKVAEVTPLVTERSELKSAWDRSVRGSIPDLLVDEPGFIDQFYINSSLRIDDWLEDKADPFAAQAKIASFTKRFDKLKGLLPNFAAGKEALDGFTKLVERWAYSIVIDTRLIEAYREGGDLKSAVALAQELYKFDPRDPTFMAVVVDGTLEAAKDGHVGAEDITEARKIAAELRNDSKLRGDLFNYWLASVQVLELSKFIPDIDVINRILRNYNNKRTFPTGDIFKPVDKDFELNQTPAGYGVLKRLEPMMKGEELVEELRLAGTVNRTAMILMRRFLDLYQIDGVTIPVPISITEEQVTGPDGEDKTIYIIEYILGGGEE
ncbi:MAG: hypothetical protein PF961_16405 [Planctomycetota bacterium]|jgi:hypothetical protein|nr:hypothetical protein [Planctomycetota bacterium]